MKKFWTVFEWVISIAILIVGFLHLPILVWCGVDVFALRGILIFTTLPTVAICAMPFAICLIKHLSKKSSKNITESADEGIEIEDSEVENR